MDTRFRHRDSGSNRALGNNGGVIGGGEISPAALQKYTKRGFAFTKRRAPSEQQRFLSEDQKHSSGVAKVHYQKQRYQEVALKGYVSAKISRYEGIRNRL